jgi:hypothetical protein
MKSLFFPFCMAIAFVLNSCSNHAESEQPETSDQKTEAETPASDTTKFKFDFALANIPSPASSIEELGRMNAPYDNSMLNNPSKVSSYTTEFQKSLNLGIYNIDMAYAMIHNRGQEMLQYMKSVFDIADALGLRQAVGNMVGQRAESNISNKDSLFRILDQIFIKSDSYLRSNERVYTATLIFAGSWIESLYITGTIGSKSDEAAVKAKSKKLIWEQRFHLGNLVGILRDFRSKKENEKLLSRLEEVHKKIIEVREPSAMTEQQFNSITSAIKQIRNSITG